ncbi:MAG: hypothetical protein SFW65_04945 [Alphaproteobacteria bacterium]|nr:hypothetical protein [Alphaproteobacteria bacterium]
MLDSITKPDTPTHSLEREWGPALFAERKADHIRRRVPTWRYKVGVALGSFAMLTFAAQPVIDLQLERMDRERIVAKRMLLDDLQKGKVEITWDGLRLLSTPTSDQALETSISKVYERYAGEFMTLSVSKNIPLPENFTLGAAGYMLCGTGPAGSHSSNGCHACVASNRNDSERNRRYLARLLRRLAQKSTNPALRAFAKATGDGDMDVFAQVWFAKWPEASQQLLLKETCDLSDAAKSLGISFDTKEHLLNRVIEVAINQIAMRKQSGEAAVPFVPILPTVIHQAAFVAPAQMPG